MLIVAAVVVYVGALIFAWSICAMASRCERERQRRNDHHSTEGT